MTQQKNPIFVPIDTADLDTAHHVINQISPYVGGIKLGLEFFTRHGLAGIHAVMPDHLPLFLDLKFHDIPNTVAGAIRAAVHARPHFITLHASGGAAMLQAARAAVLNESLIHGITPPKLLAVTLLTSLNDDDLLATGQHTPALSLVEKLAHLAKANAMDGVICSPHEIAQLRQTLPADFILMVPGIRPAGTDAGDQKRVMTPPAALAAGADYLVIGRPITAAPNPAVAAKQIMESLRA